jgi:lysophospholipase L1-like esterase
MTVFAAGSAYAIYDLTERITHMVPMEPVIWLRYDSSKNLQPVPKSLQDVRTIVCFGDSITRGGRDGGYVGVMQQYIRAILPEQKIEIVNSGVDGDSTRNLLQRIDKDVWAHKPQLVTLLVGVNDIARRYQYHNNAGNSPRGVQLDEYIANVKSIISQAKEHNVKIILISPGLIIENIDHPGNERLTEYVSALEKLAKESNIQYVDVHKTYADLIALYRKETGATDCLLTRDGTHPNQAGAKVIANCLLNEIGITSNSRFAVQKDSPW